MLATVIPTEQYNLKSDPAYVKRFLELKEEEIFDKIDRTVELLDSPLEHPMHPAILID